MEPDFKNISALSLPLRSNCLAFFQDLHPDTFRQFSLWPSNNSGETSSKKDLISQEPHLCSAAGWKACGLRPTLLRLLRTRHRHSQKAVAPGYLRDPDEGVQSEPNLFCLLKLTSLLFLLGAETSLLFQNARSPGVQRQPQQQQRQRQLLLQPNSGQYKRRRKQPGERAPTRGGVHQLPLRPFHLFPGRHQLRCRRALQQGPKPA